MGHPEGKGGERANAEAVRQEVKAFIEHTLKLAIAPEKSHIRPSRQGVIFLGYWVKIYSGTRVVKLKMGSGHTARKTISERMQLHIPPGRLEKFCTAKSECHRQTTPNTFALTLSRSELLRQWNTGTCEYCETTEGPFQVHHMRKMKDVANGKELWQKMMAARCSKTLILCMRCHQLLHAGRLLDKETLKLRVRGEPCARDRCKHGSARGGRVTQSWASAPYSTPLKA